MESLVIYNSQIETILNKINFKMGFITACRDAIENNVAKYWFRGNNVICVRYNYDIVNKIVFCNSGEHLSMFGEKYEDTMIKIKEEVQKDPLFPPSLLDTFTDCIFAAYDPNPTKLDKLLAAIPKFDKEFLALFQKEIDELTSSVTDVTTVPKPFEFYKNNDTNYLYYVGEAFETTVLLFELASIASTTKIIDLRELGNFYTKIEIPEVFYALINDFIGAMHEVVNKDELISNLIQAGCKDVSAIEAVETNYHVEPKPISFEQLDITGDTRGHVIVGDYDLYVYTGFGLNGSIQLKKVGNLDKIVDITKSVKEYIEPVMFLSFAINMLSEVLRDLNFILVKMPEVRSHLYKLWVALAHIPPVRYHEGSKWQNNFNEIATNELSDNKPQRSSVF